MSGNNVPVVQMVQTDWVIGWKAAAAYLRESDQLVFMPLVHRDMQYEVEAAAVCDSSSGRHSNPPDDNCHCGFNAWAEPGRAVYYMEPYARNNGNKASVAYKGPHKIPVIAAHNTLVILRVGLYGDVIDAIKPAWGYRSEQQRVADVFFNDTCAVCPRDATSLGVMNAEYPLPQHQRQVVAKSFLIWPLCGNHVDLALRTVEPSDLSRHNNVKIHWGFPASE